MNLKIMLGTIIIGGSFIVLFKGHIEVFLKTRRKRMDIKKIMSDKKVTFDEAKGIAISNTIKSIIRIDREIWKTEEFTINKGDRVSFTSEEGFISGEFLGLKTTMAEGYSYNYVLKSSSTKILICAPIETIDVKSIRVYEKGN
jgi:hypothetical protein